MIQLYKRGNTNYENNGDIILEPTKCELDYTLNGDWIGTLKHPLDSDGKWKHLQEDVVLKIPSMDGSEQLYQVVNYEKDDAVGIMVDLEHIFMQSVDDCWIDDKRPTNTNGQGALNAIITNPMYTGSSDISKISTAYYMDKNLMEAINGDDENSFINRWGGEIYYDNYHVSINERVGSDRGIEILYGKNIAGMYLTVDYRDIVTRIKPKAYNGYTMTDNGCVDSPNIDKYRTVKKKAISFDDVKMREDTQDDDEDNGVIICDTQEQLDTALQAKCEEQFEAGIDSPSISGSIDLVLLQNTREYEDIKNLETVRLGDTVHCRNKKIDVVSDTRIVRLVWDAVRKKVISVEVGELEYNYFDNVSSTVNAVNSVIDVKTQSVVAETIKGVIDASNAQMKAQKTIAQKSEVRALLFQDLDPESSTYGAMCLGTQGIQIAHERTEDGSDWKWGTAINYNSIIADYIITGILSDKSGNFYLNMDTGELVMNDGTFKGTINTSKDLNVGQKIILAPGDSDNSYSGLFLRKDGYDDVNMIALTDQYIGGQIILKTAGGVNLSLYDPLAPPGQDTPIGNPQIYLKVDDSHYISFTPSGLSINGKSGLTGTFTVQNGISVEAGLVTGIQ